MRGLPYRVGSISQNEPERMIPRRFQEGGVAYPRPIPVPRDYSKWIPANQQAYDEMWNLRESMLRNPVRQVPGRQFNPKPVPPPTRMLAQEGGVATDDSDNPPWQPARSGTAGMQAAAPDESYQGGGTVDVGPIEGPYPVEDEDSVDISDLSPRQQSMIWRQAVDAVRGQSQIPTYPAQTVYPEQQGLVDRMASVLGLRQPEPNERASQANKQAYGQAMAAPSHFFLESPKYPTPAESRSFFQQHREMPTYTAKMLTRPPRKVSGYAGELGYGYQEGGVVDDDNMFEAMMAYARQTSGGPMTPEQMDRLYRSEQTDAERRRASAMNELPEAEKEGYWGGGILARNPDYWEGRNYIGPWADAGPQVRFPGYQAPIWNPNQFPPDLPAIGPDFSLLAGGHHTPPKLAKAEGGVIPEAQQGGVMYPPNTRAPKQQASPVAGEPSKKRSQAKKQQPGRYEFGPADFFYTPQEFEKMMEAQTAKLQQGQGYEGGGVIPKEFMRYLANGGLVKKFTPDHHLMFSLGMKYALSPKQAAKELDKRSTANPMPP